MTPSCISGAGSCCSRAGDERDGGGEPSCASDYVRIVSAKEAHDKSKLTSLSLSSGSPALSCCARIASVSSSLSLSESRFGSRFCFWRRRLSDGSSLQYCQMSDMRRKRNSPGYVFQSVSNPCGVSIMKQLDDILEELCIVE